MLDIQAIRNDFPILSHKVYGKPLVYLDNAATTQKPRCVVEKIENAPTGFMDKPMSPQKILGVTIEEVE